MLRLLGSQGMGYFNSAYEIYATFCVIATSGLPVAMSVLISATEDRSRRKRIFSISLGIFFVLGLICMAAVFALAQPFARFLKSPETYYCLMAISPAIFFICLSSAVRGYFQGLGKMTPTAVSQTVEATGKLLFGLCFAWVGIRIGLSIQKTAALAVMGLSLSEGVCAAYLFLSKKRHADNVSVSADRGSDCEIATSLLRTALPITLSSSVLGITKLIDMTVIFRRLGDLGYGSDAINSAYGGYTTLAIPLFSLAPALVSAIALPLVPSISSARAQGDIHSQSELARRALKLTALISAPIGAGLSLFARPILELIFSGRTVEIDACAPLLCVLGLSVLPACIITVQNAILQAYERPALPVISMLAGSAVKVALCYALVGDMRLGMLGVPISTLLCDFVVSTLNMRHISRHTPLDLALTDTLAKPYLCAVSAAVAVYALMSRLGEGIRSGALFTFTAVALTAAVYFSVLFLTRTLSVGELEELLLRKNKTLN